MVSEKIFDWRSLSPQQIEQNYNPRVAIADPQACLDQYAKRSKQARQGLLNRCNNQYDVRYGERNKETLDLHLPDNVKRPPLLLFIHGGYWRALDKSDHSFIVPSFLEAGMAVANVNYDLCPDITLDVMVEEVANALRFCIKQADEWGVDDKNIILAGHSAGAHLVASLLAQSYDDLAIPASSIKSATLFTGIYDPEIALHVSVNEEIQLTEDVAKRHDYLKIPPVINIPLLVSVGAQEPEGWIDQSRRYADFCESAGLSIDFYIVDAANHFDVLAFASTSGHPHNKQLLDFIL